MTAIASLLGGAASMVLPWRWILGGVVALSAAALYFYVGHLRAENERLAKDVAIAVDAANRNAQALIAMDEFHAFAVATLSAERDAFAHRVKVQSNIQREIDHAPSTDDGPVAPVLARALDGLRAAGADQRGGNRSHGGPRALARLPSDAPAPDT